MATDTLQTEPGAATDSAWHAALDHWKRALNEAERLTKELDAVALAYEALRPDEAELQPIARKRLPFYPLRAVAHSVDLEAEWERFLSGEGKIWWGPDPEKLKAEMRADLDAIADWRARRVRAAEVTGYEALNDAYDAAWSAECDARDKLFQVPADDAEGALLKLDLLFGPDAMDRSGDGESFCDSWTAAWVGPAMDDAKRFIKAAA